jgi:hypothetical protein
LRLAHRHPAKLWHLRKQHGRRNGSDPGNGAKKLGLGSQGALLRQDASDALLQLTDLGLEHGSEIIVV